MSKPKPSDAERLLHLDGNGRIGALVIGSGADHRIDVRHIPPGFGEGKTGGMHGHLRHDGQILVCALGQDRVHDLRIEDAGFVEDIAVFNAGRADDEILR